MEKLYRKLELKEAKKTFNISANPDGYTITGLKSRVTKCLPAQGIRSTFVDNKDNGIIYMPDEIDDKPVCKWNMWCIPTKSTVLCGERLWKELPKAVQTRTATYYLDHMEEFDEDQKIFIEAFIKRSMKNVSALLSTDSKTKDSIVSMSLTEAKNTFDISKSQGRYNIAGFKTVPTEIYSHVYERRKIYTVVLPDMIDGVPVGKYATESIKNEVIVICSSAVFERLKRGNKVSTVYYYLSHKSDFSENQGIAITKFIKDYTDDIVNVISGNESIDFYLELLNIATFNQSQFERILELNRENSETIAMLSEYSKKHDFIAADNSISVKEIKKQWSYSELISNGDIKGIRSFPKGEKFISINKYKGNASKIVVPGAIGNLRVMEMVLADGAPDFWESIKIENPDIILYTNFDKCKKMADKNGCIVVEAGDRRILAGYRGANDQIIISDGVTEMSYYTFKNIVWNVPRKIVVPNGCKIFDITPLGSNQHKPHKNMNLRIEIPNTVTEIHMPWNKDISCTIVGEEGSYAEQFAHEKNIDFIKKS